MPDPRSTRTGARIVAVEEATVTAATRALDLQLQAIADDLRAQAPTWRGDPAAAMRGRRALAARLRRVRPGVAVVVRAALDDAVTAGAGGVDVRVTARDDVLVDELVRTVDARVRAKASTVARRLTLDPVRTDVQVRDLAARVLAVASPGEAAASSAVVRAADLGSAAAVGGPRTWVTQPGCCVHCAGFAGSVAAPGQPFLPVLQVADRPLPWAAQGVVGPPLHDHCRCHAVEVTRGLPTALVKAAAVDLAAGNVGFVSAPAKARAAARLLRTRAPLTAAARRKAQRLAAQPTGRARRGGTDGTA